MSNQLIYSNGTYYVGEVSDDAYDITIPVERSTHYKVSIPTADNDNPDSILDTPSVTTKIKQIPVITLNFKKDYDISYSVDLNDTDLYKVDYLDADNELKTLIGKWSSYDSLKEYSNNSFIEYFMLTFDCSTDFKSIVIKVDSRKIRYISVLEEVEDAGIDDDTASDDTSEDTTTTEDITSTVSEDTTSEEVEEDTTSNNG